MFFGPPSRRYRGSSRSPPKRVRQLGAGAHVFFVDVAFTQISNLGRLTTRSRISRSQDRGASHVETNGSFSNLFHGQARTHKISLIHVRLLSQ